jgi:hypothetical protein
MTYAEIFTKPRYDLKFKYEGFWRRVSNVTFEWDTRTLIGFEMRKNGKFSYKIKRFSMEKITDLAVLPEIYRSGPVIGRP